jgi:hypothetical protein
MDIHLSLHPEVLARHRCGIRKKLHPDNCHAAPVIPAQAGSSTPQRFRDYWIPACGDDGFGGASAALLAAAHIASFCAPPLHSQNDEVWMIRFGCIPL